jgi:hypothetical protein
MVYSGVRHSGLDSVLRLQPLGDQDRPKPNQHAHRVRPCHRGATYQVSSHASYGFSHAGGLARLTRLTGYRLGYEDVALLAISFGAGWLQWWWFDSNDNPIHEGSSLSETALKKAGFSLGVNPAGERCWTSAVRELELVQVGWVDLLVGVRRTFLERIPRWRVKSAQDWRILIDPAEWAEKLGFLVNPS